MSKKKKILVGILLAFILVVIMGVFYLWWLIESNTIHYDCSKCSFDKEGAFIFCDYFSDNKSVVTKEKIPCSSNEDCLPERINSYCSPGGYAPLLCLPVRQYCDGDNYCRDCCCYNY